MPALGAGGVLRFLATLAGIVAVVWGLSILATPAAPLLSGRDLTPLDPPWAPWEADPLPAAAKEKGEPKAEAKAKEKAEAKAKEKAEAKEKEKARERAKDAEREEKRGKGGGKGRK